MAQEPISVQFILLFRMSVYLTLSGIRSKGPKKRIDKDRTCNNTPVILLIILLAVATETWFWNKIFAHQRLNLIWVKLMVQTVLQDSCNSMRKLRGQGKPSTIINHIRCNRQNDTHRLKRSLIYFRQQYSVKTGGLTCLSVGIGVSLSMASYFAWMAP